MCGLQVRCPVVAARVTGRRCDATVGEGRQLNASIRFSAALSCAARGCRLAHHALLCNVCQWLSSSTAAGDNHRRLTRAAPHSTHTSGPASFAAQAVLTDHAQLAHHQLAANGRRTSPHIIVSVRDGKRSQAQSRRNDAAAVVVGHAATGARTRRF